MMVMNNNSNINNENQTASDSCAVKSNSVKTNGLKIRRWVQIGSAVVGNGYLKGFKSAGIYQGMLKKGCVPFLNCYSCPGALFSCPIGAMQATISEAGGKFDITAIPMLVIGFLAFIGTLVGRAVCGWTCPFGFLQDLLNKIPSPKFKGYKWLSYIKYVILIVFVFVLPAFWLDDYDMGAPTFCKYICPAGTLEGGIPLTLLNSSLRSQLGWLFTWKMAFLVAVLVLAVFFRRPFCRWVCPLGAFYGPFNKISFKQIELDNNVCVKCGKCSTVCPMNLTVTEEINTCDCIRCYDCKSVCPVKAIK